MYVDPATLETLDSARTGNNAHARAQRLVLLTEQVTMNNIDRVAKSVLLRLRAKIMCATCKRHWECMENLKPRTFE